MRGFLKVLFPLMALVSWLTITCSQAKADDTTFLYDVRALGFTTDSPLTLLNAGYGVCIAFANGANGADVAHYIYTHTDLTVTQQDAAMFVITAAEQLCPQWDHRSQGTIA